MENWLSFSVYILQNLHEEGYEYFVFENSPKLNDLMPLGKKTITISARYLCKVYPFKEKESAENKVKENENNYMLHYEEPLINLAKTKHFVAVIIM